MVSLKTFNKKRDQRNKVKSLQQVAKFTVIINLKLKARSHVGNSEGQCLKGADTFFFFAKKGAHAFGRHIS